jgi:hypothetical protein
MQDYLESEFEVPPVESNNVLWMRVFVPPDGVEDTEGDALSLRFFTDLSLDDLSPDIMDNMYTIHVLDGETFCSVGLDLVPNFAEGYQRFSDPFAPMFADYSSGYAIYDVLVDWDALYNTTKDDRVGTDLVRMSLGVYDNDSTHFMVWQDYNVTDERTPLAPPSDEFPYKDQFTLMNWGYFQIDTTVTGVELEEPLEQAQTFPSQSRLEQSGVDPGLVILLTVLIILCLVGAIIKMALSGSLDIRTFIMVIVFIAVLGAILSLL